MEESGEETERKELEVRRQLRVTRHRSHLFKQRQNGQEVWEGSLGWEDGGGGGRTRAVLEELPV